MRSIKPGRAPSMMGGFAGIFMAILGVAFLIFFSSPGPSTYFDYGFEDGYTIGVVICIAIIIFAIAMSIYNFVNATKRNRYSVFDITEGNEEPDPLNQRFGNPHIPQQPYPPNAANRFCPYCGAPAQADFEFCNVCGKKLP